jgi:hypothetical protein
MKLTGTVNHTELEGGHWVLRTDAGDQYQLVGSTDGLVDGGRVEVEGNVDKQAMSFGMVGAHFKISKIKKL